MKINKIGISAGGKIMNLGLGIDTGGTYTDSVIMDMESGSILSSNKSLTTYPELLIGIQNSIDGLDTQLLPKVSSVSVSTTLATNTTLEGKGYPAAMILIGYSIPKEIPTQHVISIKGGHNADGEEIDELEDSQVIRDFVLHCQNKVAAIAVSSYFGVRNPEHELKVKKIIQDVTDMPVVCGHELSMDLGAYERSVTALLNAQLIPVTNQFIKSILLVMQERNIDANLMMMKCDGSLVKIEEALQKPVESIFSGPAASLVGAAHLTNLNKCITVDVGGTSTDISNLFDGVPQVSDSGAIVGGWSTMVKAIRMSTSAMGGDSHVWVQWNTSIGPERAIPICHIAPEHPEIIEKLNLAKNSKKISDRVLDKIIQPTSFFIRSDSDKDSFERLTEDELTILNILSDEPMSVADISKQSGQHSLMFAPVLKSLIKKRHISQIGFTPTDALHVLGDYDNWDSSASNIAAEILASYVNMDKVQFCKHVKRKVAVNIAENLVSFIADDVKKQEIEKLMAKSPNLKFDLEDPVVLIGAPVEAFVDEIKSVINGNILVPEYYGVGNAVGALVGNIIHRSEVMIRPAFVGSSQYAVFSEEGKKIFDEYKLALDFGEKYVKDSISDYMNEYGLSMDKIDFDFKRDDIESVTGSIVETRLVGLGIGTPRRANNERQSNIWDEATRSIEQHGCSSAKCEGKDRH